MVDEYSRYPVVVNTSSTSFDKVWERIEEIISMFGVPHEAKSDNGPPFNAERFRNAAKRFGMIHRKITPFWPEANSEAEQFMRNLKKIVIKADIENTNWKKTLNSFLLNYRATPHPSTGVSPASLIFAYEFRTKLPQLKTQEINKDVVACDEAAKSKMKEYAELKNNVKPIDIKVGDMVLVKNNPNKSKFTPSYIPVPFKVIERKGNMITVKNPDKEITRNISWFKKLVDDKEYWESLWENQSTGDWEPDENDLTDGNVANEQDQSDQETLGEIADNVDSKINTPVIDADGDSRPRRQVREPAWLADYVHLVQHTSNKT